MLTISKGFGPLLVGKAYLGGSTQGQWLDHKVASGKLRREVDARLKCNCQRPTLKCPTSSIQALPPTGFTSFRITLRTRGSALGPVGDISGSNHKDTRETASVLYLFIYLIFLSLLLLRRSHEPWVWFSHSL